MATRNWYLEGYAGPRRALQRIRLFRLPFRVGRDEGLSLERYPDHHMHLLRMRLNG